MPLHLIYARAANGVIGKDNRLPWHIPEDMAHFKQLTQGCPVVSGPQDLGLLPRAALPLPGTTNIVVTRQADWQAEGAHRAGSLTGGPDTVRRGQDRVDHRWRRFMPRPCPGRLREVTEIAQDLTAMPMPRAGRRMGRNRPRAPFVSTNGLPFSFRPVCAAADGAAPSLFYSHFDSYQRMIH